MSEQDRLNMLERSINNPEMVQILSHPAIKELFANMDSIPAGGPALSFRQYIADWEERQARKRERRAYIDSLERHLMTVPGTIVEYCIERGDQAEIEQKIRELFAANPEVELSGFETTLGIVVLRVDRKKSRAHGFIDI